MPSPTERRGRCSRCSLVLVIESDGTLPRHFPVRWPDACPATGTKEWKEERK